MTCFMSKVKFGTNPESWETDEIVSQMCILYEHGFTLKLVFPVHIVTRYFSRKDRVKEHKKIHEISEM